MVRWGVRYPSDTEGEAAVRLPDVILCVCKDHRHPSSAMPAKGSKRKNAPAAKAENSAVAIEDPEEIDDVPLSQR